MKQARNGFLEDPYDCKKGWPDSCFVQCGGNGLIIGKGINEVFASGDPLKEVVENVVRETAFFEAFPRDPSTFIRGEGATIEEAEEKAWGKYERILACPGHEFERKGYTSGAAICKNCNLFMSEVFEPSTKCVVCDKPTNYSTDKDGNYYCEDHKSQIPEDKKHYLQKAAEESERREKEGIFNS
jgi:hypothetical protein